MTLLMRGSGGGFVAGLQIETILKLVEEGANGTFLRLDRRRRLTSRDSRNGGGIIRDNCI